MSERDVALAIVGAGPAGLAAAAEAAALGVETVLLDLYASAGGQYYKLPSPEFAAAPLNTEQREGQERIAAARAAGAELWTDAPVWGLYRERPFLVCLTHQGPQRLRAQAVILAAGAYDRPVPFPGWTLPGVVTAGAVQVLLKSQRVLPGRRILLAGSGPLQLSVAAHLAAAGAKIEAVLELRSLAQLLAGWRYAGVVLGQRARLAEGLGYLRALRRARVPIQLGWTVVRAEGDGEVERAIVARVDAQGRPRPATERTVAVDTVCVGHGLVPSTQLARHLECETRFHPHLQVFVPVRDAWLETSVPGFYVAGDAAEVAGKEAAILEGRLAALAAARRLGRLSEADAEERARPLQAALARERRFGALLHALFGPLPGLAELPDDDTILCRCEGVTLAQVRQAIADGATIFQAVKDHTRGSMGLCQGRMCSLSIAQAIARERGCTLEEASRFSVRPPAFPVALEDVLDNEALA